jgi:glycosyltransferase involved in cell wall biosynthesis
MKDLSICIPTWNRAPFLKWTLDRTALDFGEAKVIVCDNASTDGTDKVVTSERYIRQPKNIGAFPNMRTALLAANTKYCVFLGDDDYLLRDEVQKGIDFLETHPEVLVYYAPCQLYDEINQKSNWEAFYPAEDETFTRSDTLWNFILSKHVWPEHAIYRRKGLDQIIQPRGQAYWCFVDLANAAVRGPVHFAKTPYYRNITQHPVGNRPKLGDLQCLTEFDAYRWGLEVLACDIFRVALASGEAPTLRVDINNMIRQFLWARYEVASRIHAANGRTVEAEFLRKRMDITGFSADLPQPSGPSAPAPRV